MKAIRGDNPRTTNQRVYLMPVVPSPPPEKPLTPDVEQFSLSFPSTLHLSTCFSSIYLSICSSLSPLLTHYLSLSFSLLVAPRLSLVDPPSPSAIPLRSRSRVITLLLSDMSLCYRHNQPASFSLCSSSRALTRVRPPSPPRFPAALFATCRTLAHPRDLAQSVLLY